MPVKKAAMICAVGASLTLSGVAYAEGNADAGAKLNSQCEGCHGIEGWRTAFPKVYSVPKIGGQHAGYIVAALKAYQSGGRDHPTMKAIAASLSEQQMADLAAYYSAAGGQQQSAASAPAAPAAAK